MKEYNFVLELNDVDIYANDDPDEVMEDMVDMLFGVGCNDFVLSVSCGHVFLDFDRQANSLEEAIESAKADVIKSGICVCIEVVK